MLAKFMQHETQKQFRVRPLETPGGGVTIPKKKFLQGKFFLKKFVQAVHHPKKNSCKQSKVINQTENQSDFNLLFDGYLSADIKLICSETRTVFGERSSRKTVSFEEQIMFKDKYPSFFSPQMEAIVCII